MPIPLIVMALVGFLSAVWPVKTLDHQPPRSGGVFAPHFSEKPKSEFLDLVQLPEVK